MYIHNIVTGLVMYYILCSALYPAVNGNNQSQMDLYEYIYGMYVA